MKLQKNLRLITTCLIEVYDNTAIQGTGAFNHLW